jgi:hypothetical protein
VVNQKPLILRPVAWIATILMALLMEFAGGIIFDIVAFIFTKLDGLSTTGIVILTILFGSAFIGLVSYSVTLIAALIVGLSDKIYPSNHAFRYYFVGIYELLGCAWYLVLGVTSSVKGGSMILYYAEIIWLAATSAVIMFLGRAEANARHSYA